MSELQSLSPEALAAFRLETEKEYERLKSQGLSLNMARGKPAPDQLDLSDALYDLPREKVGVKAADGTDCRNYGLLCGIPECRSLFGELFGVPSDNVIACGSSSLTLMYDVIAQGMTHGFGGNEPWIFCEKRKFIAVVPGYDRHFAIAQHFGFELLNVPMTPEGPDMDLVEELVKDPDVKGMFCVPKYSNPDGITYSDETVRRLAAMRPAAKDFRVIWDEAYIIHDLYEDDFDTLANVFDISRGYGNEDHFIAFASTSKITFAGAGVSAMAASDANIREILGRLTLQIISYDKINQLKHSYFYKTVDDLKAQMKKHAALLRPKFDVVLEVLEAGLGGLGIAYWNKPKGGYFISLDVTGASAKRVYELCRECGLTLTAVGATFPYGKDPNDRNIRLAPSCPSVEELRTAAEIVTVSVRLAACEALGKD